MYIILLTILFIVNVKLSENFTSILVNFYKDSSIILLYHKDDERHMDKSKVMIDFRVKRSLAHKFGFRMRYRLLLITILASSSDFRLGPNNSRKCTLLY